MIVHSATDTRTTAVRVRSPRVGLALVILENEIIVKPEAQHEARDEGPLLTLHSPWQQYLQSIKDNTVWGFCRPIKHDIEGDK